MLGKKKYLYLETQNNLFCSKRSGLQIISFKYLTKGRSSQVCSYPFVMLISSCTFYPHFRGSVHERILSRPCGGLCVGQKKCRFEVFKYERKPSNPKVTYLSSVASVSLLCNLLQFFWCWVEETALNWVNLSLKILTSLLTKWLTLGGWTELSFNCGQVKLMLVLVSDFRKKRFLRMAGFS